MGKNKFYGVRAGRVPGVYTSWAEAQEQINGFSDAKYKKFSTKEDAENYVLGIEQEDDSTILNEKIDSEIKSLLEGEAIAFIDGSFKNVNGQDKYSFAAIIFTSEGKMDKFYRAYTTTKQLEIRNVAGEIEASTQVISWAITNEMKKIKIFYDYEGVEKWATKEWSANNDFTKKYTAFYEENSSQIDVVFEHVKSHSRIKYNEEVDALAKDALESETFKTYKDGSIKVVGLDKNKWYKIVEEIKIKENLDLEIKETTDDNRFNVKLDSTTVTITCYKYNRSYLQGKVSNLIEFLITYAIEMISKDKVVIDILNNYHSTNISQNEAENRLKDLVPDLPASLNDSKVKSTLLSAAFNSLYQGYMPDYTCLIQPVIRIFEYYLHSILHDLLGLDTDNNGKNNFSYFDKDSGNTYQLQSAHSTNLCDIQLDYVNNLYTRYNQIRHPYSHWNQDSMDTAVITDIETARGLIKDNLQFINKYYKMF